jgi:hypothetical protein
MRIMHNPDKEKLDTTSYSARLRICSHACHRTPDVSCWRQLVGALYRRMLSEADFFALRRTQTSDLVLAKTFRDCVLPMVLTSAIRTTSSLDTLSDPFFPLGVIVIKQFSMVTYGCARLLTLAIPESTEAGLLTLHKTSSRQRLFLVPDSKFRQDPQSPPLSTMLKLTTSTRQK